MGRGIAVEADATRPFGRVAAGTGRDRELIRAVEVGVGGDLSAIAAGRRGRQPPLDHLADGAGAARRDDAGQEPPPSQQSRAGAHATLDGDVDQSLAAEPRQPQPGEQIVHRARRDRRGRQQPIAAGRERGGGPARDRGVRRRHPDVDATGRRIRPRSPARHARLPEEHHPALRGRGQVSTSDHRDGAHRGGERDDRGTVKTQPRATILVELDLERDVARLVAGRPVFRGPEHEPPEAMARGCAAAAKRVPKLGERRLHAPRRAVPGYCRFDRADQAGRVGGAPGEVRERLLQKPDVRACREGQATRVADLGPRAGIGKHESAERLTSGEPRLQPVFQIVPHRRDAGQLHHGPRRAQPDLQALAELALPRIGTVEQSIDQKRRAQVGEALRAGRPGDAGRAGAEGVEHARVRPNRGPERLLRLVGGGGSVREDRGEGLAGDLERPQGRRIAAFTEPQEVVDQRPLPSRKRGRQGIAAQAGSLPATSSSRRAANSAGAVTILSMIVRAMNDTTGATTPSPINWKACWYRTGSG